MNRDRFEFSTLLHRYVIAGMAVLAIVLSLVVVGHGTTPQVGSSDRPPQSMPSPSSTSSSLDPLHGVSAAPLPPTTFSPTAASAPTSVPNDDFPKLDSAGHTLHIPALDIRATLVPTAMSAQEVRVPPDPSAVGYLRASFPESAGEPGKPGEV